MSDNVITGRLFKNPADGRLTFDAYTGNNKNSPIYMILVSRITVFRIDEKGRLMIRLVNDGFSREPESEVEGKVPIEGMVGMSVCDRIYYQVGLDADAFTVTSDVVHDGRLTDKVQSFTIE